MRFILIIVSILNLYANPKYTNSLIDSTSPYLIQHAHNPVNWFPYSPKAFEKAKNEKKLIFLSIGYSTCHWCHVMEKESFEDETIASFLNKDYISIKVDKEQMPQIDEYYQHIYSKLKKGRNGWPLNVILTPQKELLYIATYIPPFDDYGIEGMMKLLPKYADLFHNNPKRLQKILNANKRLISRKEVSNKQINDQNISSLFVKKMLKRYDRIYKGFDKRPKFPMTSHLNLLLDIYLLDGDEKAFEMVTESLNTMAKGGMFDQVEGGFFRYATDPDWVIPHFEKMLYTNAELISLYSKAYIYTQNPLYKKVVKETISEFKTRLSHDYLFFAATDADSKEEEGGYFIYRYDEVKNRLKKAGFTDKETETHLEYFDITKRGNFENKKSNVHFNTGFDSPPKKVTVVLKILKQIRAKRKFPFIDKKIITSWNAIMIKALFDASSLDEKYYEDAKNSLDSLLKINVADGVLCHYSIDNAPSSEGAFLEDYAFLIDALLCGYEKRYERRYLNLAKRFTDEAIEKFYKNGKWYINSDAQPVEGRYLDRYYTTALSKMFNNLLTLSLLTYDLKLFTKTKKMIANEKNKILKAFDRSPQALRALMRLKYGDILLKSNKNNLLFFKRSTAKLRYPFLYTKVEKTDIYLLCDLKSCFYYDKNITKVLKKISLQFQ